MKAEYPGDQQQGLSFCLSALSALPVFSDRMRISCSGLPF